MRSILSVIALLVLVAQTLGTTGCRSASGSSSGPRVFRAGQAWSTPELELSDEDEQTIEAHARFAAGIVEELNDAPEVALEHFQSAAANDPANEQLTLEVVARLVGTRQFEDARLLLERSAQRPEASGRVLESLGKVYELQGNPRSAIQAYRESIRRMPQNLRAYQELAQLYLGNEQVTNAVAILEEAVERNEPRPSLLLGVAEIFAALRQLRKEGETGDLKPRGMELLDRVAADASASPAERLRLAGLYEAFGEREKAEPVYEDLLGRDPDLPGLQERLVGLYLRADDREKARERLLILAQREPPRPEPHILLGLLALEDKRFQDAIASFERARALKPQNPEVYLQLAMAHLALKQPDEALQVLESARATVRPTSFQIEYYTALVLLELKRYEQAIRHFTTAEVLAGAAREPLSAAFYFQSGMAYERARQFDDASIQFERAIEKEPDFAEALNYLGYMWAEQGIRLERAHELIERAVQLEPENPAFLDSLAWVLHRLGRSAEALPHQRRAIELNPEPDATLHDHLGDILNAVGKAEEARAEWQRAFELDPQPAIEKKLRGETTGTDAAH